MGGVSAEQSATTEETKAMTVSESSDDSRGMNPIPTTGQEAIEHIYANASMMGNGHTITYRGYTLEKVEWVHPEHSEFKVCNRDGAKVESFTLGAFDSAAALQERLDDVIEYDPESVSEWLNRDRDTDGDGGDT